MAGVSALGAWRRLVNAAELIVNVLSTVATDGVAAADAAADCCRDFDEELLDLNGDGRLHSVP